MELDDELCLCFHVTQRKIIQYLRRERPIRASQLSECGGAGTGCGWCRPYLQRLFEAAQQAHPPTVELPETAAYAAGRGVHLARRERSADSAPDKAE